MPYDTLITTEQLAQALADGNARVFDCRFDLGDTAKGRRDYDAGHIRGARYAHLDDDLAGPVATGTGRHPLPDAASFVAWLRRQGLNSTDQVVVYDDGTGAMASRLWWMLRHWLGHRTTALLDGGWVAWTAAGLPVETALPNVTAGSFSAIPDPSRVVDTDTVVTLLGNPATSLLDARMPPRFRGEIEPLDPVAGHVPGARNLPFSSNLDEQGRFADADSLRRIYRQALNGNPPDNVVCMCGSGVTACHNLLAMDIAGLQGARLYAGSWSAWCSDPARAVDTGD